MNVLGDTVRLLQDVPEGTRRLLWNVLEDCGAVVGCLEDAEAIVEWSEGTERLQWNVEDRLHSGMF